MRQTQEQKQLVVEVFRITIPAIMDLLAQTLLAFFDMLMVASLGASAVSAVGLGHAPVIAIVPAFMAVGMGTTSLVSRAYGANNIKEGKNAVIQSLLLCIPIALVITIVMLWKAEWILQHVGRADDLDFIAAKQYYKVSVLSLLFICFNVIYFATYRAIGKTKVPMIINIVGIFMNIFFNWIFIFVLKQGVFGAAIATLLSKMFSFSCFSYFTFLSKKYWISLQIRDFSWDRIMAGRILKIGIPAAAEQLLLRFGMLFFEMMIISLGNISYAAHKIASNAEAFSYNLGYGFSVAAAALVGQQLGKNSTKGAEYNGKVCTLMSLLVMSSFALLFFSIPHLIISIFTKEIELQNLSASALRIVSICQPFLAVSMVLAGALRGAGATKSVLLITVFGIFGVRLPLTYLFLNVWKTGLLGAWWIMTIDLAFRSAATYYVFKKGKWKYLKV